MPTTRDDLIADWHNRLADASHADAESSQRAAWLARLQVRLYRFLLSLYGDGHWNAPPREGQAGAAINQATPDPVEVLPLAGKPAKNLATIRSVLETVASAQSAKPASGPLAKGLADGEWIVVARQAKDLDLEACVRLLHAERIVCRWSSEQRLVLVPAAMAALARNRIAANRFRLRPSPAELPFQKVRVPAASWKATIMIATAPYIAIATTMFVSHAYSESRGRYPAYVPVVHGLAIFAALFALLFLVRPIGQLVQVIDRSLSRAFAMLRDPRRPEGPQP
jgi:hypothetical protein